MVSCIPCLRAEGWFICTDPENFLILEPWLYNRVKIGGSMGGNNFFRATEHRSTTFGECIISRAIWYTGDDD